MDSEDLGQRIRIRREQLGLSQEELAERLNKDQRAVSQYELGTRRVLAVDLPSLASTLQVSILYFYEDELRDDDLGWQLLNIFHQLPTPVLKQMVIRIINDIRETVVNQPNN